MIRSSWYCNTCCDHATVESEHLPLDLKCPACGKPPGQTRVQQTAEIPITAPTRMFVANENDHASRVDRTPELPDVQEDED